MPSLSATGVAVNVQNVEERGILRAVFLNGGERAVVRAGIVGVVVELAVMEHAETGVRQDAGDLVADADHVLFFFERAVVVACLVLLPCRHGVGLRAVRVDDEHLRAVGGTFRCGGRSRELRSVQRTL